QEDAGDEEARQHEERVERQDAAGREVARVDRDREPDRETTPAVERGPIRTAGRARRRAVSLRVDHAPTDPPVLCSVKAVYKPGGPLGTVSSAVGWAPTPDGGHAAMRGLGGLVVEERSLAVEAPAEAAEPAVGGDHAVARHDDRDGVAPARVPDGPRRAG